VHLISISKVPAFVYRCGPGGSGLSFGLGIDAFPCVHEHNPQVHLRGRQKGLERKCVASTQGPSSGLPVVLGYLMVGSPAARHLVLSVFDDGRLQSQDHWS
jgi:hypothetical protein